MSSFLCKDSAALAELSSCRAEIILHLIQNLEINITGLKNYSIEFHLHLVLN